MSEPVPSAVAGPSTSPLMTVTEARMQEMLDLAALRGAAQALELVGLSDVTAAGDLKDLRDLLANWKLLNNQAFRRVALWGLSIVLFTGTLWVMPHIKRVLGYG